ncbi:hypothetical protein GCM10011490_15680 [Pseudoclavibacter endophyticus]|uniref:Signal peptidase I n=1 Tax=Pseudoclavibacter endophyticus TaxID=1778590 RepID=A0A6H9WRU4_9MICO|nr:signal peptidase I [Pseudoclavibacter endophyticus]KAB1649050.1 signal peptidase I [Pseudoclavibacter endophyticus]GGA65886.1 hypothetical protein GCM10011490_15680 [Pseudoclavibacter endophyticus]
MTAGERRRSAAHAAGRGAPVARGAGALASVATTLLAIVGVAVLGWLAFAALTGAQLIVFKTGSMSPTMPQGAAAVVLPVPASDLEVGDVVTVQSHGSDLPVTHRIVAIEPAAAAPGATALTLRGDANTEDDQAPYVVTEAHRVVASMPGLGTVIALAQTPISMGVFTLVAALLVVRAFWPRRVPAGSETTEGTGTVTSGAAEAAETATAPNAPTDNVVPETAVPETAVPGARR